MIVQPRCSGASSRKFPHRLTPPGGSLQAGHPSIFPRQRIWLIANIALILSLYAPKVNPDFSAFLKKSLAKNFTGYHTLSGSPALPRSLYAQARTRRLGLRPGSMQTDSKPDFTGQTLSAALEGSRPAALCVQKPCRPIFGESSAGPWADHGSRWYDEIRPEKTLHRTAPQAQTSCEQGVFAAGRGV